MQENLIIKAMEDHAETFGLEVTTIGQFAVQNRNAYDRIKRGTAHRDTIRRVAEWIHADKASRAQVADKNATGKSAGASS